MKRFASSLLVMVMACIGWLAFALPLAAGETNAVTAQSIVRDLEYSDFKAAHLLAFIAQADKRPLYTEGALLAMELTNGGWQLTHVYRHPKEQAKHLRQ